MNKPDETGLGNKSTPRNLPYSYMCLVPRASLSLIFLPRIENYFLISENMAENEYYLIIIPPRNLLKLHSQTLITLLKSPSVSQAMLAFSGRCLLFWQTLGKR